MFFELQNISQSFEGVKILNDITLQISKGEICGLVGASGCGKSTLLYIASKLLEPDKGRVLLNGKEIKTEEEILNARRQSFGFIYQFHNLIPELTGYENVLIASEISSKTDKNFINEVLKELGILEKAKSKPATLSGGEAQRFAIARAFACKPSIIFADEPTGNLDPKTAETTFNLILNLAKKFETAVIFVTHNLQFTERFDKCYTVENAKIKLTYEK